MAKETFNRDKPHLGTVTPPSNNIGGLTIVSLAGVLTNVDMDFDGGDQAGYVWLIAFAPPTAEGVTSYSKSDFKLLCTMENVLLAGNLDLLTVYQNRFGNVAVGAKVAAQVWMVDSVSGSKWNMGQFTTVITGT